MVYPVANTIEGYTVDQVIVKQVKEEVVMVHSAPVHQNKRTIDDHPSGGLSTVFLVLGAPLLTSLALLKWIVLVIG